MFESSGGTVQPSTGLASRAGSFGLHVADGTPVLSVAGPVLGYRLAKRTFDLILSLAVLILCALLMLALNPWYNRGPLLCSQDRMGLGCRPFWAWKFRSMTKADKIERGAFDALDAHRITRLGGFLRAAPASMSCRKSSMCFAPR